MLKRGNVGVHHMHHPGLGEWMVETPMLPTV